MELGQTCLGHVGVPVGRAFSVINDTAQIRSPAWNASGRRSKAAQASARPAPGHLVVNLGPVGRGGLLIVLALLLVGDGLTTMRPGTV